MATYPNSTLETLLTRRTIRAFESKPIDPKTREWIERAASQAPTSAFKNSWSAILVTDPQKKAEIAKNAHQAYIADAALLYVFVCDSYRNREIAKEVRPDHQAKGYDDSYAFFQGYQDAMLALSAMMTAAESLGLGTLVLGSVLFKMPELMRILDLPAYTFPVLALGIGYPAEHPQIKPRMPLKDQIFENSYPKEIDFSKDLEGFSKATGEYTDTRHPNETIPPYLDSIARHADDPEREVDFIKIMGEQGYKVR